MKDGTLNNATLSAGIPNRTSNGQFVKGGPGRIPGTKNKLASGALADLRSMTPDAVDVVRNAIANGDVKTACWLIERTLPAQRVVELDGAEVQDIISALTAGDTSPTEAKTIAHTIAHLKNVSELDDLRTQVESLGKLLRGEE
jgi:hypothetical protein